MTVAQVNAGEVRWTLAAIRYALKKRLYRNPPPALESLACKTWEIAPGETTLAPPARFLSGQLERITGWAFSSEHPCRSMQGGSVSHGATRGFLLRNVLLLDGALYKDNSCSWLTPRMHRLPQLRVEHEIERGALYCTAMGNKYFGQWLMDDCVAYPMACEEGLPVTTAQPVTVHTPDYEKWLEMKPFRLENAFFRELVIFDDCGQNRNKHLRFRAMSNKLQTRVMAKPHPGVMILRGNTGELRLLRNEMELAERLRKQRGFRILDPARTDVQTIVSTCAGARTVVGVEGSGLMHGILLLQPGGSVLTLQPPNRFVRVYKDLTDRDDQQFAFVVGHAEGQGFSIEADEVERTLDLLPN